MVSAWLSHHPLARQAVTRRAVARRAVARQALARQALARQAVTRRALARQAVTRQAVTWRAVARRAVEGGRRATGRLWCGVQRDPNDTRHSLPVRELFGAALEQPSQVEFQPATGQRAN